MRILSSETLSDTQKVQVVRIWNNEYPVVLAYESLLQFEKYLEKLSDFKHYYTLNDQGYLVSWLSIFNRHGKRWFAMIIDSEYQNQGLGKQLLNQAKQDEPQLYGWVVDHNNYLKKDGQKYSSPLDFYLKNGFSCQVDQRLETSKLSAVRIYWKG